MRLQLPKLLVFASIC